MHVRMRQFFSSMFYFGCVCFSVPGFSYDLKQTIAYGLNQSPRLKGAAASREISSLAKESAFASFLPSLDSQVSTSVNGSRMSPEEKLSDPSYQSSLDLKLSQTIWDGGIRSYGYDVAVLKDQIADISLKETRDQFILDVIQAYIAYSESTIDMNAQ